MQQNFKIGKTFTGWKKAHALQDLSEVYTHTHTYQVNAPCLSWWEQLEACHHHLLQAHNSQSVIAPLYHPVTGTTTPSHQPACLTWGQGGTRLLLGDPGLGKLIADVALPHSQHGYLLLRQFSFFVSLPRYWRGRRLNMALDLHRIHVYLHWQLAWGITHKYTVPVAMAHRETVEWQVGSD